MKNSYFIIILLLITFGVLAIFAVGSCQAAENSIAPLRLMLDENKLYDYYWGITCIGKEENSNVAVAIWKDYPVLFEAASRPIFKDINDLDEARINHWWVEFYGVTDNPQGGLMYDSFRVIKT